MLIEGSLKDAATDFFGKFLTFGEHALNENTSIR